MVGRFVEQQQTGLGGEGAREEAAALEAAGEGVERPVLGQAEARDQVVDAEVLLPVLGEVIGAEAGGHDVADVAREILGDLLGQPGDADPVRDRDRPRIGGGFPGGDAHEGRLAGAVAAQQADPLAFLDLEVEVVEHGRTAEADVDIEETEQGHSALK